MANILNSLEDILKKIYYDVSNPNSFGSIDKLYNAAKSKFPNLKREQVENWLKSQETYSLYKPLIKKFKRNPMISSHIDQWWQSDLSDMSSLSKDNKGYKYLLMVIDVLSKYAWAFPLKNKKPASIVESFEKLFRESKRKPIYLYTDAGTEYVNNRFKNF